MIMQNTAPEIQKEFGFDQATKGVILGALFWGYSLFQLPGGWLSDRFGPRTALASLVAFWSLVTIAAGFAGSASSLVILLFLLGTALYSCSETAFYCVSRARIDVCPFQGEQSTSRVTVRTNIKSLVGGATEETDRVGQ